MGQTKEIKVASDFFDDTPKDSIHGTRTGQNRPLDGIEQLRREGGDENNSNGCLNQGRPEAPPKPASHHEVASNSMLEKCVFLVG
jgi:hypothetical protein